MQNRFIETKFHILPWRARGVSRAHLLEQLNTGLREHRKLTLVSAPAGYGKSTLISSWLHSLPSNHQVAWLSLDEADSDPNRFLEYWIALFRRLDETLGQDYSNRLGPGSSPSTFALINNALIGELAATDSPMIVVLDDYHLITHPTLHEALEYFIEHQPEHVHLVICTREDPPLPLARLRTRGQLTEIRAHHLRFTMEEAVEFFKQSMNLDLEIEAVNALEERTEGWAAGLQLAAMALQNLPNPQDFIRTFRGSHRYILDYLAEEVLHQQDQEIRSFLFQTAILDKFNASLCQAVTGRSDNQTLILRLEQANLFLVPLDSERVWYRYHHLFADYLRAETTRTEQAVWQEKAARWCEANDLVFEAVKYAQLSGNQELVANMVESVLQKVSTWSGGDIATLVGWLDALPSQYLRSRPALSLHASRALYLAGRIELSEKYINQAEESLRENSALELNTGRLQAIAALYHGSLAAFRGQVGLAIEQATYAQNQLPPEDLHSRARAADTLGLAYEMAGDLARASRFFMQASDLAQSARVSYLAVNARCEAGLIQINQGKLHLAMQTGQQAIDLTAGQQLPPLGLAFTVLADISWERNELAAAEQFLIKAIELSRQGGLIDDLRLELLSLARLKQSTGDLRAAQLAIEQADSIIQTYGIARLARLSNAQRARLQLANGLVRAANQWAGQYQELYQSSPVEYTCDYEDLTLARVHLVNEAFEQGLLLLAPLVDKAETAGRLRTSLEAMILLSVLEQARTRTTLAVKWLEKAVALAEQEGFLRLFLDEGAPIARLLPNVRHIAPRFVDELLEAFSSASRNATEAFSFQATSHLTASLSEQELRVLRLIVAGKSNQEVAETLVISLGTAKWHVHNILQKLGVSNRPQAIARAHELGIA